MVKHVTIDLDDETHKALSKLKDEAGLTWGGILIDWKKRLLAVSEIIRKGGVVKTDYYALTGYGPLPWELTIGTQKLFYEKGRPSYGELGDGFYKVTLVMEKLEEEPSQ